MNMRMILLSSMMALGLLSGCGNANEAVHSTGHDAGQHHNADTPTGEHGGHGNEGMAAQADLNVSYTFASGEAKADENAELSIRIADRDGSAVNDFEMNHEKLLHLIIVNEDLSYFSHIHPDFKGNGEFTVDTSFPAGGNYKLFADFVPKGGSGTTLSEWVKVEGEEAEQAAVTADSKLVKAVDGKEVELALSGMKAGEDVTLTFNISDAQTKQGIGNLEPYLGAVGHVVILSADAEEYIHVHPLDEKATGPAAQFATSFPTSGIYKIWGQFQHEGKVFTVPFVVEIQ